MPDYLKNREGAFPGSGMVGDPMEALLKEIKNIHSDSYMECYGSPRMRDELLDREFSCSVQRVARLMKTNKIRAQVKRKFKVTTNSKHRKERVPQRT